MADTTLRDELQTFQVTSGNPVLMRVKRSDGLGGIYETLHSGSSVAPSTMPDLTLMRRTDLIQAANGKLIEPIDLSGLAVTDLFGSGLALGQINGEQYGVPYALEIQHAAYHSSNISTAPRQLDDLLQTKQVFLFPAGVNNKGVNTTLLAQYLAAGGRVTDGTAPVLDAEPLEKVLAYYQRAMAVKLAGSQLLDYTNPQQYWPLLVGGKASIGQVSSTLYLAQRAETPELAPAPLPMPLDNLVVPVDSWLWVVTTTNAERQSQALSLLAWMLEPDRQGRFSKALGVLPSRRSAFTAWGDDAYVDFVTSLLDLPSVPPPDTINPDVAQALQHALEEVLNAGKTASDAATEAASRVAGKK